MRHTCLDLLQQGGGNGGGGGEGGGGEDAAGNTVADDEVVRQGELLKRGGIGQQFKKRHFVCTRAGYLHYFDTKFEQQPKGSVPLFNARVGTQVNASYGSN